MSVLASGVVDDSVLEAQLELFHENGMIEGFGKKRYDFVKHDLEGVLKYVG